MKFVYKREFAMLQVVRAMYHESSRRVQGELGEANHIAGVQIRRCTANE